MHSGYSSKPMRQGVGGGMAENSRFMSILAIPGEWRAAHNELLPSGRIDHENNAAPQCHGRRRDWCPQNPVDPMLAPKGAMPPLRLLGQRERNPLIDLPPVTDSLLETVTHCLITHCQKGHFDHLDRVGKHWLRSRKIPVICTPHDAKHLRQRGLNVSPLAENHHDPQPFLGGRIRTMACKHGKGMVGLLMEHGVGYLIEMPGSPACISPAIPFLHLQFVNSSCGIGPRFP